MTKTQPERLVVPPKKWRDSDSLRGYANRLKGAIDSAENVFAMSGDSKHRRIYLEPKMAKALLEILCQAIHTEQGHGS